METPENLATRGLIAEGVLAPGSQLDPKKVAATAMENGEYAPGLIANLAQREEYQCLFSTNSLNSILGLF